MSNDQNDFERRDSDWNRHASQVSGDYEPSDADVLRRYERRIKQESKKNKKINVNTNISRERNEDPKSPTLAEKFMNFIGCGAKKTRPNKR